MTNDAYKAIIEATGAMAEMSAVFYTNILKHVNNQEDALELTKMYISVLLERSGGN